MAELLQECAKKRSTMVIPLFKWFVLWRGDKRIVVGEEGLRTAKISSVFKVSTFYYKVGHNYYESIKVTSVWLEFQHFRSFIKTPSLNQAGQKG